MKQSREHVAGQGLLNIKEIASLRSQRRTKTFQSSTSPPSIVQRDFHSSGRLQICHPQVTMQL